MQNEQAEREIQQELFALCDLIIEDFLLEAKGDSSAGELEIPRVRALVELGAEVVFRLVVNEDVDISEAIQMIRQRNFELIIEAFDEQEAKLRAH